MKKIKFSFPHSVSSKKRAKMANLLNNFLTYYLHYHKIKAKIKPNVLGDITEVIVDEKDFEKVTNMWHFEVYYLFPHASMWSQQIC
jgi:hypothetical protein